MRRKGPRRGGRGGGSSEEIPIVTRLLVWNEPQTGEGSEIEMTFRQRAAEKWATTRTGGRERGGGL